MMCLVLDPFKVASRITETANDVRALWDAGLLRPVNPVAALKVGLEAVSGTARSSLVAAAHALIDPDGPALIFHGKTTTWTQLRQRVFRLANHLRTIGVEPGDSVGVMLPNRPEYIEALQAGLAIGAHVCFINPKAPAEQAHDLIQRTGVKVLVTHRDDVDAKHVLTTGNVYEAALSAANPTPPDPEGHDSGRVVIFTSGTTGRPKGAVRNLDSANLSTFGGFLRTIPFKRSDVHMVVAPLYHSSGSGFATVAQVLGSPLVLVDKFSAKEFCRTVQEQKITTTAVVPTMLHAITEWPGASEYDLSSLRVVVCTGSALRQEAREAARNLLGDVIYDLYGSTEMAWVSVASPQDQRSKPGTVGRIVPSVSVRITDSDGNEVPRGDIGEIWATSPILMESYLDDEQLSSERMRDGYVSVRDLGFLDREGYLHVVDRVDDMIISGGVNVYPAEAEIALSSHPAVREVAVVGIPDPRWGQRVVAAVVVEGKVTEAELIRWAKDNAEYAAVPKEVRIMESMPLNDVGKIDKRAIVRDW